MASAMAKITVTVTEAKNRLTALIRRLGGDGEITVTKRDRPTAVIVPWEAYQRLQRRAAAARLAELRDGLAGSGLDAHALYRESRRQLEDRS